MNRSSSLPPLGPRVFRARRASAMLMVLWAIILLSAAFLAWAQLMNAQVQATGNANRALEARACAMSGLAVAWHPQVKEEDFSVLRNVEIAPGQKYDVTIEGEGGRLNINWLIARALQDPASKDQLERYLEVLGVDDIQERQTLVDSLLDWVDPDDLRRLNGREAEPGYYAGNRPFETYDELAAVNAGHNLVAIPGWKDKITFWSAGPLDLNWAPRELLLGLPFMDEAKVDKLIQHRDGPDGERHTEDDQPLEKLEDLQGLLGIGGNQLKTLTPWVTLNDRSKRYVSTGISSDFLRIVSVVARLEGGRAIILDWQEYVKASPPPAAATP
jgi:type II secretory pathway component PulK